MTTTPFGVSELGLKQRVPTRCSHTHTFCPDPPSIFESAPPTTRRRRRSHRTAGVAISPASALAHAWEPRGHRPDATYPTPRQPVGLKEAQLPSPNAKCASAPLCTPPCLHRSPSRRSRDSSAPRRRSCSNMSTFAGPTQIAVVVVVESPKILRTLHLETTPKRNKGNTSRVHATIRSAVHAVCAPHSMPHARTTRFPPFQYNCTSSCRPCCPNHSCRRSAPAQGGCRRPCCERARLPSPPLPQATTQERRTRCARCPSRRGCRRCPRTQSGWPCSR